MTFDYQLRMSGTRLFEVDARSERKQTRLLPAPQRVGEHWRQILDFTLVFILTISPNIVEEFGRNILCIFRASEARWSPGNP
jgi:hypothetical protein